MRKWFIIPIVLFLGVTGWVNFFTSHAYVTTPSMYPTIPPGSMVFIRKEASYHVGDVIEFRGNGLDFLHRIIKISPAGVITTKGDNPANAPDAFVPATTSAVVAGKAVLAPRWLGFPELIAQHPSYGLAWLRTELGFKGKLVVVACVGALALLLYGPRRRRTDDTVPPGEEGVSPPENSGEATAPPSEVPAEGREEPVTSAVPTAASLR